MYSRFYSASTAYAVAVTASLSFAFPVHPRPQRPDLMSFFQNLLAPTADGESSTPENDNQPNTRSRAANRHQLALAARRSPSPAPPNQFFPDTPAAMATPEQLAAIRDELRAEVRREIRAETTATAAAMPDAIRRKPEIPAFNKDYVEIWIKRMEHAYTRAGITTVNDKFAWLETKFPVGTDPKIDEFLYGDATDANWNSFLAYLRKEHGTTKQQRAAVVLDGFKRDGRRPSQYAAALIDKTKDISLDDVRKEMLLREMPTESSLVEKV